MGLFANTGVCCFALITGYFINSTILPIKKVVKTAGIIWFYSVLVIALSFFFSALRAYQTPEMVIIGLTPILSKMNWYGSTYFVSLFFIPLIALSVRYLETRRRLFTYLIGAMAFFFSVVGTITPMNSFVSDLSWLILLYYIGIYIRVYFKSVSKKKSLLIAIGVFILVSIGWFVLRILEARIALFGKLYEHMIGRYSLFTLILGLSIFNIFRQIEFQSKAVNLIASTTFGIYLLHDNQVFRSFLWHDLLHTELLGGDKCCFLYLLCYVALVFACGMVIDLIRSFLFDKPVSKVSNWLPLKMKNVNLDLGNN